MDQDFLLGTDTAWELYHGHAERLPIIDYHCHLDPKMVAEDYRFRSITELWLGGDHYKWRAMRTNGDSTLYFAQPVVPLDAFGAAYGFRYRQIAEPVYGPRDLRRV